MIGRLALAILLTFVGCTDDLNTTPDQDDVAERPVGERPSTPEDPDDEPDDVDPVDPIDDPIPDPMKEAPFYGEWYRAFGAAGPEWVRAVATDTVGNVYVAGSFDTQFTVGGETIAAVPGEFEPRPDTFIASFEPDGSFRWVRSFGSDQADIPFAVVVDASDNVYVVGYNQGDLAFPTSVLENKGSEDVYIVSYESDGRFRWAESFGGPFGEAPRAAAINHAGQLVITGSWQGLFAAGTTTLQSTGDFAALEVFTLRYDTVNRRVDWVTGFKGFLIDVGTAVAISDEGEVAVGVSLQYDLAIDENTTFESGGDYFDGGIVKLDDEGAVAWSIELDGAESEEVIGLALDPDGGVYATGVFEDEVVIGTFALQNASDRAHDVWVTKLTDGVPVWAHSYGGEGFDQPLGLAFGLRGLYLTGRFDGSIAFDSTDLTAVDAYDVFVTRFEPQTGVVEWARSFGGIGNDQSNGIVTDTGRGVYVAGYNSGAFQFNEEMQPAAGEFIDGFVFRLEEQ